MRKTITFIVLAMALFVAGYVYFSYYNRFDDGGREGVLYSFSRKGNVLKTYEGTILQPGLRSARTGGLNTNEFHFSVTDEAVADSLKKCVGKQVLLHYVKYRKSLPWRGENNNNDNKETGQYIVDQIQSVKEPDAVYNNL
ncbi:MAG: hypothetical protein QM642_01300 [Edaphocola sp.]